jgi:hypothetical protein
MDWWIHKKKRGKHQWGRNRKEKKIKSERDQCIESIIRRWDGRDADKGMGRVKRVAEQW